MKNTFTSLERVKCALEHKEPDKIPFDMGGSKVTGITATAYKNLRNYLKLPEKEIRIFDTTQQLSFVDEDVFEHLKIDVKPFEPDDPINPGFKTDVRKEGDYKLYSDEWGIVWRMPVDGGLYYDMYKHPLAEINNVKELMKYPFPKADDPGRFKPMKEKAEKYFHQDRVAYIMGRDIAGIFEVSLWLRGFENFFTDLVLNPGFAESILDIITEHKIEYWDKALDEVGENVLVVSETDDLASQEGLLISYEMYRKYIKPRFKRVVEFIRKKAKTKVYIFYHSCGAVKEIIPDLIECGIDILNPVQVSAKGMDSKELKKLYGNDLTFWGGGADTQIILPSGTPEQVRDEVKRRIDDFAPGGGFIFNTVHNIQADVSPENIIAMWETLQEYGKY